MHVLAAGALLGLSLLAAAAARADDDLLKRWDSPPRVTLKAAKIRVNDAVERIRKDTGQDVVVGANGDQAIALDLHDATFFQAIEEVAQRAGLILVGEPGKKREDGSAESSLRLDRMPEEMKRVPPVLSGPAHVSLLGVFAQRSASRLFSPEGSAADDTPRQLWVEMRVTVESGLESVLLKELRIDNAKDDADKSLAGSKSVATSPGLNRTLRVELEPAGSGALMIPALSGRAVFLVPEEITEVRFTAASRNATKKLGEAKFVFKRLERKGEDGKPELVVSLEGTPCPELGGEEDSAWRRVRIMTDKWGFSRDEEPVVGIYLYDRSDHPIGSSGSSFGDWSADDKEAKFTLDEVPARIEVRAITKVQKREIPFRFAELPIPR